MPYATGASSQGVYAVSGDGAFLVAPPTGMVTPAGISEPCQALASPQWQTTQCGSLDGGRGPMVWLVQSHPGSSGQPAWRAEVLTYSDGAGGWVVDLWTPPDVGQALQSIKVKTTDLGGGLTGVVFGYRHQGSGYNLEYDIVVRDQGSIPRVGAHRGPLSHGAAVVEAGGITEYEAQYPTGEPSCCPAYFQESQVTRNSQGAFYLFTMAHVAAAPPSDF
jgi:hypothetical protein